MGAAGPGAQRPGVPTAGALEVQDRAVVGDQIAPVLPGAYVETPSLTRVPAV
ncbi:hypothetical protein SGL43_07289 [Streptomyces globisporus]|uniref:Uncharacterized protein n=1 Tax=Streptomyces globisporus TaxID=1908 RepID=A0ABM9H977_STRGL|nr:hypothetical protein SGL43_07289 [Streptomyces globisporus]